MPNIKLSYEKTSKTKIRALLLFLVLNGLLLLGCTSRDTEASKPEFLYKKRFESALFYVENVWKIKIKSADCSKGQEDCKYRFIVEDVLKGDKNYAKKEYSLNQNVGLVGITRFGQIQDDKIEVYWPKKDDIALLLVENVNAEGTIDPFFTLYRYSMDAPRKYISAHIYLTPFVFIKERTFSILKMQQRPEYVPPLGLAHTIGEQESDEKIIYELPNVWEVKIYSDNLPREIKMSSLEGYVPKRYEFKMKIERVLRGKGDSLVGKVIEATHVERCSSHVCEKVFAGFKENSRTVLIGLTGLTDNFIYQGKLHLADFVDENNLKNSDQQAEHYVWKPYMDRTLKRFVNLTKRKGYKPPEKAEYHFSETIQVK